MEETPSTKSATHYYPFAMVYKLRVLQVGTQNGKKDGKCIIIFFLQIVCGISFLVIGTVAFIEEKGHMNLGLGIPAGGATILATGSLIYQYKKKL